MAALLAGHSRGVLLGSRNSDKNGYLDHREFRVLLGKDGLNLKLREEDEQLLMDELSDENGAIEPKDFTKYLAVRVVCCESAV